MEKLQMADDGPPQCQLENIRSDVGRPMTSADRNYVLLHWLQSFGD